MSEDYESIRKFIREHIIDPGLSINHLETTKSSIRKMTERFAALGWIVQPVEVPNSRFTRYKIESPSNETSLSMVGGKVFRHPAHTEQICMRKHLTKRMLEMEGLPTAVGGDFSPREKIIAHEFFAKMSKPVVVKPTDSGGSRGVTIGVTDDDEFDAAWEHALAEGRANSNVLVEEFVRGVELRAYVIGAEVVSIVARVQPFVVGDDETTVSELAVKLQQDRQVHYRAMKMPVVVDWDFVRKGGHDLSSVPRRDEIVFLSPFSLSSRGSFTVEVTDSVSENLRDIARAAKDAIPHLEIAGVDLLVEDIRDPNTVRIMEVNTAASLETHRYPTHGKPRAIEDDIVDYFHSHIANS